MPLGKQIVPIAEARRTGEAAAVGVDPARLDESGA
jgi:hypothetical protein